jgi:hypothetical protein
MQGRGSSDFATADTRFEIPSEASGLGQLAAMAARMTGMRCGWTTSGGRELAAQGAQAGPVIAGAELLLQPA